MTSTLASQEELKKARVPLGWRDNCSAYVSCEFYLERKLTRYMEFMDDLLLQQTPATLECLSEGKELLALGV